MSVTARAEDPAAVPLIEVGLGVEHASGRQIRRIDLRVFGVYVKDGIAQNANGCDGINLLPEEVAWIEVAADAWPRDGAQFQHCFRTVCHEARMHLDRNLDAVIGGELSVLRPIWS